MRDEEYREKIDKAENIKELDALYEEIMKQIDLENRNMMDTDYEALLECDLLTTLIIEKKRELLGLEQ